MVKYYLVSLKVTGKNKPMYFVCTKNRRDEFSNPSAFHGIGFLNYGDIENIDNLDEKDEKEIWIPWDKINYVESLIYVPKATKEQ